jgi:hypothetical protein
MKPARRLAVAALVGLVAVAGVAIGAMLSSGALGAGLTITAQPPGPNYLGPTAYLRWSMPDRYALGWEAWQTSHATYARSYIYPRAWSLIVDGCGSQGGTDSLTRFDVAVTGVGFPFKTSRSGSSCRRRFDNLPRLGQYYVALTVHTKGDSDRTVERVTLRDWLIVSLGDSMASGEGSPDDTGRYQLLNKVDTPVDTLRFLLLLSLGHPRPASDPDFKVREIVPVRWQDKRCHRSARAGHAQAAAELERRDPHSSVTYISLACSGAEIKHLINTTYSGQQPPADPQPARLQPQLTTLRRLLRAYNRRPIDALLLSIGINDLDFSDIIHACATNPAVPDYGDENCVYDTGVNRKLNDLGPNYDTLARALRSLDVAETYLTDYPGVPFGTNGTGCGMLGLRGLGIGSEESTAMYRTGQALNSQIRDAANRNGWNFVEGMTQAFLGRDYCKPSDQRYFIRLEESLDHQGTEHGTSHPNPNGHKVLGSLLTRAIGLGLPAYPFIRATVTIDQVKMGKSFKDRLDDWTLSFHASSQKTIEYRRGVGYMGRWVASGLQFAVDIYEPPRPPRFATKLSFDIRPVNACCQVITVNHSTSDSWGVGREHEVSTAPTAEYPDGFLRVRYHVVGERILDPAGQKGPVKAR